jgi:deoxyhypusine synthase
MNVREFILNHYKHFNAATLMDSAVAYEKHLKAGNKMMITLGGAMSTAELGISLAEMIREDKVHAICSTGANLEEDVFNLVAHEHYYRVPNYRDLTPEQEQEISDKNYSRVTDTCIPEYEAMRRVEKPVVEFIRMAEAQGERYFPHEILYKVLKSGALKEFYQIDPKHSWLLAAAEKNLPIWVPGWEDSTIGNYFVSLVYQGELKSYQTIKDGKEYMANLMDWYMDVTKDTTVGFFQIGGGIAGDFAVCAVPAIRVDLDKKVPHWSYFCQISDSTTSYGSYSGAVPNEKITWDKLSVDSPKFVIESDATIVAPLIFAYVLGW